MTTTNYNNGKVYKIEPICEYEEGEIYIGSTTKQYLSQRMTAHRTAYNHSKNGGKTQMTSFNLFDKNGGKTQMTSFNLFDKYGINNCQIVLLELVNVNSKEELHQREAHYIRTLKCVNKNIPSRTKKEYREDNKEKIALKNKEWIEDNKEKIALKKKEWYESNKRKTT
jgi:hypothetical protein